MPENILNVNTSADAILRQREKLLQSKENQQSNKKVEFDERNYLNLRLNPKIETVKKVKVRILPVSATDSNIFTVLHTHSMKVPTKISKSGYKSFICLNEDKLSDHDSNGCPLCKKSDRLLAECNTLPNDEAHKAQKKALFKEAMQCKAKETFIVRVIERDHEDEGVKFWRFNAHPDGTGIYDQLMSIFDNRAKESVEDGDAYYKIVNGEYVNIDEDEYNSLSDDERTIIPYNVFDLNRGKDFIITLEYSPSTDKTTIKIGDANKETPLSKNVGLAMSWVNDEKTWRDLYSLKSYDYLELIADKKIPYFDKNNKKWVDKATVNPQDVDVEAAKEVLREKVAQSEPVGTVDTTPNTNDGDGDDLPF